MSLINVSIYAGDAILMQLPLLGGEAVNHDWNYLLGSMNALTATPVVEKLLFGLGTTTIGIGIVFAYLSVLKTNRH